ncbi:hypothetical protein L2E82_29519 [Cichorium intybus]|uniref:Uncharacterized protein n=1 Tax=Cichorium intybus TaxID=13427 RepID=A0ACB9CXV6_CICIN|nr:hypothetical protein L2E82_29519 [Cichorium intybus]
MRTRRVEQSSPLLFDSEIERTPRRNRVRRRLVNMSLNDVSVEDITNEPTDESAVPPISQLIPNPSGNPASTMSTWGVSSRDGTSCPRQPVQVPQRQQQLLPVHKPQPPILQLQPQLQPQTQPQQQQQYQYQAGDQEYDDAYDDEDEGWMPNNPINQNQ